MVRNYIYAPLWKKGAYCFAPVCWSVWRASDVRLIYLDLFAGKLQNVEQWMTLESKCSLMIFRSHGQRSRSNCCSLYKCRPLFYFKLLYLKLPNLVQWMPLEKRCFPLIFWSYCQGQTAGLSENAVCLINIQNFYC